MTEGNLVRAGNDAFVVSKNTDRKNVITAHVYEVDEEGAKGTEMVWANVVVFIVKDDNVLKLPVGLNRIEANAFEGIAADIICLPDYVTLEDDSLAGIPAGTIIYFNSDTITPFYDNFVLGTEVYRNPDYYWIDTGTPTLEYFNGNGCCTNYFCLDTSDN